MEKEFVPYEQTSALKELGFDKSCYAYYDGAGYVMIKEMVHCVISAPTYSQAFRWFREKYQYMGIVLPFGDSLFDYRIYSADKGEHLIGSTEYNTYEEAELECLKKLIQIVKEKK